MDTSVFKEFFYNTIRNASTKLAYLMLDEEIAMASEIELGFRLKQTLLTTFAGFTSGRNHFIYDLMEKTVRKILPSGIFKHKENYYIWMDYKSTYSEKEPNSKVIKINDLRFLFTMWMVTLGMSVVLLLVEFLVSFFDKIVQSFIGLILMLSNVRKFQ